VLPAIDNGEGWGLTDQAAGADRRKLTTRTLVPDYPSGQFTRPDTQPFEANSKKSRVCTDAKFKGGARIRNPKLKINGPIRAKAASGKGQLIEFRLGIIEGPPGRSRIGAADPMSGASH
jgi:hypothetical protein